MSAILGAYCFTGGVITLLGWLLNMPRWTDWQASGISMMPNAAVCAICAGAALLLRSLSHSRGVVAILGAFVSMIGAATLFEYFTGINLGIDTLVAFREWGQHATVVPGRMGPPGATSWTIIGLALLLSTGGMKSRRGAVACGLFVVCIATLSLVGYAYGATPLFTIPRVTTIALQTATMILAMGIGILFALPEQQPTKTLLASTTAGLLARRALPFIIFIPVIIGFLRLRAQQVGLFDTEFGSALRTVIELVLLTALLGWALAKVASKEVALRREQERSAQVLESITDGFHVVDASGRFTYFNPAARKIFAAHGANADALLGKHIMDEALADARELPTIKGLQRTLAEHVPTEAENFYAPWQRWFIVRHYPTSEGGASTFFLDITARKQADEKMRESEAVLRTVTGEAQVGLVMVNEEHRYRFANQTYADILGLPDANIVGKRVEEVLPALYKEQIQPRLNRAFGGERMSYELHMPAHPRTGEERFYEVVYEPRTVGADAPYVVVVIVDVTERKKAQQTLERTVDERTARLRETVGELEAFSYSIAHDMRAPLRSMVGFASILRDEHGEKLDATGRDYLRRIGVSAERLDHLTQDVLNYSKVVQGELKMETVNTGKLFLEIIESYPNLHAPSADITIQGPLPNVHGNVAAMTQVISNLLGNAVKFVAKGVHPHIVVRAETRDEAVRLWFEDNGIGIGPEAQKRLFQIFQRVHRPELYEGTGIGLAIVRKAVERMGGRVGVESQVDKGSRFWVELKQAP